jgi:hypothetical protein
VTTADQGDVQWRAGFVEQLARLCLEFQMCVDDDGVVDEVHERIGHHGQGPEEPEPEEPEVEPPPPEE